MTITPHIFEAFLKCQTKCWLRASGEQPSGNTYAEWVQAQNESYREAETKRLLAEMPQNEWIIAPSSDSLKAAKWRLATDFVAQASLPASSGSVSLPESGSGGTPVQPADGTSALRPQPEPRILESRLHVVERVPSEGRGKPAQFVPIRFVFTNKLDKDQRMLLAFDALVLSEMLGREVSLGKIIHGDDHATLKLKTSALAGEVRKRLEKLAALPASSAPPELVLNRHCGECEFRDGCRQKAMEKDDLSLLGGMTEKERKRLRKKGIFTITQLSYTFRPKRPRKRTTKRQEKYHPALRALAIREGKTHIVGTPELNLEGTPVYFDVEGLPERDFYYLIGAIVGTANGLEQHSFWADSIEDEKTIWADFLSFLAQVPNPVLVHYGSFEAAFLKRMCSRYGGPPEELTPVVWAVERSINVLSFLFAHIYFPTYSNGLKDIGAFLGAKWQESDASGIQSLVWRYQWEDTHSDHLKQKLLAYNRDDCQAVCLLTSELQQIGKLAASRGDVDFAYAPKRQATEQGAAIHGSFKTILASAYADYDHRRISIQKRQADQTQTSPRPPRTSPIMARDFGARQGRGLSVPIKRKCQIHGQTLQPSDQLARHTIIDLTFTKSGCKKVLTSYVGKLASCPICGLVYLPPSIQRLHQRIFGRGFMAWVAYQRVVLRLPLGVISKAMFDLFAEDLNRIDCQFAGEQGGR